MKVTREELIQARKEQAEQEKQTLYGVQAIVILFTDASVLGVS